MKLHREPVMENGRFWQEVNILAKEAFPPEEYIAPIDLVKMARAENFDFWVLCEQECFVGFMVVMTHRELAYLFFLAIDKSKRGHGYGGEAIRLLHRCYQKCHVVDFEMIDDTAPNNEQRKRRKEFYLRHGYRETGIFVSYQGVDFEVVAMEEDLDYEWFKDMMQMLWVRFGIFS